MLVQIALIVNYFIASNAYRIPTSYGIVSGVSSVSRDGRRYDAYLGIPYAKPPTGSRRFQDPEEAEPWHGVLLADKYPRPCPQSGWGTGDILGHEDCLYLNIFTPKVENTSNFAVLVWIYGGGFEIGDSSIYRPDYIMDNDVIFVSFNYRIGALGFLSADDIDLQGNYGMKDQVLALKWIKNNIRSFGGDPDKITIAGSSAGGASVHWHMISPLSKGLFQRAISQSGTATSVWSEIPAYIAKKRALTFATLAGCYYEYIPEMVNCLRHVPIRDIISIQHKFTIWNHNPLVFGVVVNNYAKDSFALETPWNNNISAAQIPWMIGFTSDEGATLITGLLADSGSWLNDLNINKRRLLPMLLMLDYFNNVTMYDDEKNITDVISEQYFSGKPISKDTINNLKDLVADSYVIYGATEAVLRHNATKYFYMYDHINKHSFTEFERNIFKDGINGAVHCDDLISLFNTSYFPQNLTGVDRNVSKVMVNLWINFVIHGDPNGGANTSKEPLWEPVRGDELKYLHMGEKLEMRMWFWKKRYEFWKSLNLHRSTSKAASMFFACGALNTILIGGMAIVVSYVGVGAWL